MIIKSVKSSIPSKQQLNSLIRYYEIGKFIEAENLAISITNKFPKHQFAWKVLGAVLKQTGRVNESLTYMDKSIEINPEDAEAHNNYAVTLQELGRLKEAEVSYTRAINLQPRYFEALNNLGANLQKQGKLEKALTYFNKILEINPNYAEAHYNMGVTLKSLNRFKEAEKSYKKTLKLQPDNARAHCNLANIYVELGRFKDAELSYNKAIAIKSDFVEAHRYLTTIKKFLFKDEQFLKMQKLYLDKKTSKEDLCQINFGLAKAYEDLNDYKKAFLHLTEGNSLRKKIMNYDINTDKSLFEKIKSSYNTISKNSLETDDLTNKMTPIFIVGMPRSGTTLVEQIISSHPLVKAGGELPFIKQFGGYLGTEASKINKLSLHKFRENYLKKLSGISKNYSIMTDKLPHNFRYLGLITAVFPNAKIVHVKRDPIAVCWGNFKQYFESQSLGYCYSLDDIISYYKLYENLMTFWQKSFGNRIYDLDYELLTMNQETETRKLIQYIGLDWNKKCLYPQYNARIVKTASNIQIRKKIYQGSSEQWKKYEPFLRNKFSYLLKK